MGSLELLVENVKCGGCASAIREGLLTLNGIHEVAVNIDSGAVTIHGEGYNDKEIHSKLNDLGYPVRG
ncbi:MAG: heavy-metal-associated domain-containing protein [Halobacteria archaeon]|nr:heavy-metal-associated domain-containing protein [Halobacteria archaeon]